MNIFYETNKIVDKLTNYAHNLDIDGRIFNVTPCLVGLLTPSFLKNKKKNSFNKG